ncbi:MAG: hypothetical protein HY060_20565 [Proteobacteria bacterium]|nr:hypothetical protein [Pseudomonadota bacterium]
MIGGGGCADGKGDLFAQLFGPPPIETAPADHKPARAHPVAATPEPAPAADPAAKPRLPAARRAPPPQSAAAMPTPGDVAPPPPLKVVGMTQAETVSLLGAPNAQWDRPPAKVWHYQGPDCAIDVFFYLDVSRNEFSALRYTTVGTDATAATGQNCLNRIRDVAQRR